MFAADVDGDGDLDILSASSRDDTIAWYENDGNQVFTKRVISTAADGANSVFAADVDGDGDLDVLSASFDDDTIAWYENDGNQVFTERLISTAADGAISVFAADVDGDGDLDVLSASSNDDTIAWYENDGNQVFTKRVISTAANGASSVFAADVDGDGDLDVLSASSNDDTIAWYERRSPDVYLTSSDRSTAEGSVLKLVVSLEFESAVDVTADLTYSGTADAADFLGPARIIIPAGNLSATADLQITADGIPEAIETLVVDISSVTAAVEASPQQVVIKIADVADLGDAPHPYPTVSAESGAFHFPVGPMLGSARDTEDDGIPSPNADGDDTDGIDDEDGISFGTLTVGSLNATVTVNVQGAEGKLDAWIDFNGDGNWGGPGERIFSGKPVTTGNNVLTFSIPSWTSPGPTFARFRLSTDSVAGPGGGAADGEVEDYEVAIVPAANVGDFISGSQTISSAANGARSVFAADVDGDGDMDVLSASDYDDTIAWYENDGNQVFTKRVVSTAADAATSVFAADVDGDGDLDVLSASYYDDTIAWYENDGNQVFTERLISTAADGAYSVFAADVDGDGDLDVLSASYYDDTIAWYENDGNQVFTKQ
ncbi:MAG: VCBS repeat-containing protein [Planctomycetaceae bacterium]